MENNGYKKLEEEVAKIKRRDAEIILQYLKTREDLYEKYDNNEKSIQEMLTYIRRNAEKQQKNGVAMIREEEVYMWAVEYFEKSKEELGLNKVTKQVQKQVIKKEEKKDEQVSLFDEEKKDDSKRSE